MITTIDGLPENVVGLVASGDVTAADYAEAVVPAVDAAHRRFGRIRMLYRIDDSATFSPAAMWGDMRVGLAHVRDWERIAVVTDLAPLRHAVGMFAFLFPCPVRCFGQDAFDAARAWISAE